MQISFESNDSTHDTASIISDQIRYVWVIRELALMCKAMLSDLTGFYSVELLLLVWLSSHVDE